MEERPLPPTREVTSDAPRPAPVASLARAIGAAQSPVPVAEPTRRFLWPLIGIDPAAARVHSGAAAAELAASHRADALARQVYSILKKRLAAERRRQG
jgi:hypothetical protein